MVVLEAAVGVFLVLFGVAAVVLFIILCELPVGQLEVYTSGLIKLGQ